MVGVRKREGALGLIHEITNNQPDGGFGLDDILRVVKFVNFTRYETRYSIHTRRKKLVRNCKYHLNSLYVKFFECILIVLSHSLNILLKHKTMPKNPNVGIGACDQLTYMD